MREIEYLKRLKQLEREIIPRPIVFVLAKKRENAVNPSISSSSSYNLGRSVTSGETDEHNIDANNDDNDLGFPLNKPPICKYDIVASKAHWKNVSRAGGGLYNLGNTCFLNSVLQCLTYTAPLAELAKIKYHTRRSNNGNDVYNLLENHIERALNAKGNRAFSPKLIVQKLQRISRNFRIGRQEDAHEFLRTFIDAMQKASLKVAGINPNDSSRHAETTSIYRIFGGYLQSQVKCKICKFASTTYDACLDISLEIYGKSRTLENALRQHTKLEVLDHSNRWRCDSCKKLVPATKQLKFRRLPLTLVVHLKRFSPYGDKISKRVEYPKELNMKSFTNNKDGEENFMYDLYGVLVHAGNYASSGHYYSFVKASNGAWYEMNDSSIQQVGVKRALNQQAYILFYQKRVVRVEREKTVNKKSVLPSEIHSDSVDENRSHKYVQNTNNESNYSNDIDIGEKVTNLDDAWNDIKTINIDNNNNNSIIGPSLQEPRSTAKKITKKSKYSASIHLIMRGKVGTPVLRRFIMNARALQGSKAYVGGNKIRKDEIYEVEKQPETEYESKKSKNDDEIHEKNNNNSDHSIRNVINEERTIKFKQGNETIQFHSYNNGKLNSSSSTKGWKEMLKFRKSARHYNLNKNGINSEAWDFDDVGDSNSKDEAKNHLRKLQKSLQNFQVRADASWTKKRRPDEWDSNYDQGRTKKVKNKNIDNGSGSMGRGIGKKLQKLYETKHVKKKEKRKNST
jgi:ubiquitin C-terminal hydrolase